MPGLLAKKAILLAKEESEYATDPTPAEGDNAVEVISDLVVNPVGNLNERYPYGNTLSPRAPLLGQRWVEVSFTMEVSGSGALGTAPRWGDLMEACGMAETIVASTSVTYAPASSSLKSATLYVYFDGLQHIITGCRGSFRLIMNAGETAKLQFTFRGKYQTPTDVALASPTYDGQTPPVMKSASLTFDSDSTLVVQSVELDIGNVLANRDDINDATGIAGFSIVGREGRGSFNPEMELIAGYDFYTIWENSTQKQLSISIGSSEANQFTITCPKVVAETIGYGDRNGIRTNEIPFRLSYNSGDDEISIAHT